MSDDLLRYYESELTFIRSLAGEFAQKYPKVAGRLDLGEKESADPHVERLIQAFAMLTGRIRYKIDDEFPEIVESLLNVLYPHYLRPVPSLAIGQFRFDSQQVAPTGGVEIPAWKSILNSKPAGGSVCTFRTCYPVTLWPLRITSARLESVTAISTQSAIPDAAFALRLQIETLNDAPLQSLPLEFLRLYLNGEGTAIYRLHELLSTSVSSIRVRPLRGVLDEPARVLPSGRIEPVGFAPDESLLPYSDRSFPGYRLLQEYFHFPEKFLFVDILGLGEGQLADCGSGFELVVLFRDSELREEIPSVSQAISKETFQLGCTPIVNLFERQSEPIRVTHTSAEYRVIGDRHREATTEIYSIDGVISAAAYSERVRRYEPFYSFRHDYSEAQPACFWYAQRRPSTGKDDAGTDVYLSLVDANFNPAVPPDELISAYVTCTNRDLASHLNWRREWRELQGEGLAMVEARCLVKPTATVRPPMRGSLQWRLISHLALNRLSITRGGLEALREILRLYSFHEDEDIRKRIDGLTALNSHSSVSGVEFDSGVAFCRGLDVEVEFDEERFAGSSAYMLASVLERFFGLYSAVNSYTRLTARSKQRRLPICRWPARIAEQRVL